MSQSRIVPRRSEDRGNAERSWLRAFHTFDVSSHVTGHEGFGSLRVLNEDRFNAHTGFEKHSHREFEIFTYVVSGSVEHKDSMGNTEILSRGDIQLTSAGTGMSHSEKAHGDEDVHILQIWAIPSVSNLPPKYYTRHFSDREKENKWLRVVAPVSSEGISLEREASGPAPVYSSITLYATLLSPTAGLTHVFPGKDQGKKVYIQIVQSSGYKTGEDIWQGWQ